MLKQFRKLLLPLAISLMPSVSLANYISFIEMNNINYIVEINESKKKASIFARNKVLARKALTKALINQKREDLKCRTYELEEDLVDCFKAPFAESKSAAYKLNLIRGLLGIKKEEFAPITNMPWWIFMMNEMQYFDLKVIAAKDALRYRNAALKLIETVESRKNLLDVDFDYRNMCLMEDNLDKMSNYLNDLSKVSKLEFALQRDEISFIKEFIKTFDLIKAEGITQEVVDRFNDAKVKKFAENLEAKLRQTGYYQKMKSSLTHRKLGNILEEYEIDINPTDTLLDESYEVPLRTSALFQTEEGMQKAKVNIKLEKAQGKEFDFRLWVLVENGYIRKTGSDLFIAHPLDVKLGEVTEKAYTSKSREWKITEEWEDTLPYEQNKKVKRQLKLTEGVYNMFIDKIFQGNVVKARHVTDYIANKALEFSRIERNMDISDIIKKELEETKRHYTASVVEINPHEGFRQVKGYLFVLPIKPKDPKSKSEKRVLAYLDLALQSGNTMNEEAFGNLEGVIIPIYINKKKEWYCSQ